MRPLFLFLLPGLLLLSVGEVRSEGEAPVRARVLAGFALDGDLKEWREQSFARLVLDAGNLVRQEGSLLSTAHAGDADLSGEFHVGYTATDFLVAGRVLDDRLTLNPLVWWKGDEIEVFFDIESNDADPETYNADDFQIILFPLAEGRTWGVTVSGGRRGQFDGGFEGVRTAARRIEDDERNFVGYTFEAAIPFLNFPQLEPVRGTTIGFDLALSDADEELAQKSYMTLSGRGQLSVHPDRLGRLVFADDLPAPAGAGASSDPDWEVPLAIFVGTALLAFLIWRFRKPLLRLAEVSLPKKIAIIAALLFVLLITLILPGIIHDHRRAERKSTLRESSKQLRRVLDEAGGEGLLSAEPDALLRLLGGEAIPPPERFDYRTVWVRPPQLLTTSGGTPVIDYARRVSFGESAQFEPPQAVSARALALVCRLHPDPRSRRPLFMGQEIARVVVSHGADPEESMTLRFHREIDSGETAEHVAPDSRIAWPEPRSSSHADEVTIPLSSGAPVTGVQVKQVLEEGSLELHGATLLREEGRDPVPLSMSAPTAIGVPTNLWRDRPAGAAIALREGSQAARIPVSSDADRLWVFYALQTGISDPTPGEAEREMVDLSLVDSSGAVLSRMALRRGAHLIEERLVSRSPPAGFEAEEAFRWDLPGEFTRHRDVVALLRAEPAESGAEPPLALVATFLGGTGTFLLAGVTEGRLRTHVAGENLRLLAYDDSRGTYRLKESIGDVGVTWYRNGRAVGTTLRALNVPGSALPSGPLRQAPDAAGKFTDPGERLLGPGPLLSSFYPLDTDRQDVIEASVTLPDEDAGTAWSETALYSTLALLLLAVLLVLADLLARLPRLRTKLTLGFAIASLVPLLLFFFGLSGVLEREMSRTETSSLVAQVGLVKAKFQEMQDATRRRADSLLLDSRLLAAVHPEDAEGYLVGTDALLQEAAATSSPFLGPAEVFIEDAFPMGEDPGPRVFPRGAQDHPFLPTWGARDDIVYRWSELWLSATASTRILDGRRRISVEVPVRAGFLTRMKERFGTRFDLMLYTPRGFPIAGTLVTDGEAGGEDVRTRQTVATEIDLNRDPVVRSEHLAGAPVSVAYDLLRNSDGKPVALIAAALPHREFIAARAEIRNLFLLLGAVILILELIVGTILTRRVTGPLTSLSRSAQAVARGRLQTRVSVVSPDEIGTLASSFNRMTSELGRRINELGSLNAAIRTFSGYLDRERLLDHAVAAFEEVVPSPDAVAIVFFPDGAPELAAGTRAGERIPPIRLESDGEAAALLAGVPFEAPMVLTAPSLSDVERAALGSPAKVVVVPFQPGADGFGAVLLLFDDPDLEIEQANLEFFSTMAQQVSIALENARLYQLAIEEHATGLYVHTYFLSRLREETDRARSGGRPLSIVLVSIEEAGRLIDEEGAGGGDLLLAEAVRRMRTAVRGMNIMARADQTTIEVMFPESDKEKALAIAKDVRKALTRTALPVSEDPERSIRIRPAIGLASCPEDAESAEFLLAAARRALYKAVTDQAESTVAETDRAMDQVRLRISGTSGRFVYKSEKIIELLETVERIATSNVPILIQGETGVGKEVLAELVHENSNRRNKPILKVNCAALPETLLESELFGHEKGAFTGADRQKPGRFELADGGTIFLDEVGEMSLQVQVKLLRVLEDHWLERLGSTGPIHVDVRLITATNRDLLAEIRKGNFREDLYFRLNVVSLVIPPLRARKEEIPVLVEHFIESYRRDNQTPARRFSPAALDRLFDHDWRGNVRELKNVVQRALVVARDEEVQPDGIMLSDPGMGPRRDMPPEPPPGRPAPPTKQERAGINSRQMRLLEVLAHRESITNREYADLVGVSTRTGNRDLKELIEAGLIQKVGRRRAAVYRLA